jgi:hypothetical protein
LFCIIPEFALCWLRTAAPPLALLPVLGMEPEYVLGLVPFSPEPGTLGVTFAFMEGCEPLPLLLRPAGWPALLLALPL